MQRLPALEHDMIRGVDDDVHRPHAGAAEAEPQPERRGLHGDAADDARAVARAAVGRLDAYADVLRGGRARLARPRPRMPERHAARRRDLAGDAQDRETVAAVGRHLELEDRVRDPGDIDERRAGLGVVRQDEHPARVVTELELRLGAEHAGGLDAGERRRAHLPAVREPRARQRHRHALSRGQLRGTGHHRRRRPLAHVQAAHRQPFCVWMRLDGDQPCDADPRVEAADVLESFDGEPRKRQALGERLRRSAPRDELRKPGERHAHKRLA